VKILAIADIHNDVENLMNFLEKVSSFEFDIIVCCGDITDINLPKGFKREDIVKLILEELKTIKKPILVVPGNMDGGDVISILEKEGVNLHNKGIRIENVGFYGFGGAKTPFNTPFEPSEGEIEIGLESSYQKIKDCKFKVQVTHVPPINTKLDLIYSGMHVGSEAVRKFIENKQPEVAICSHIHEGKGIDCIGKTTIINPGRFSEGYCGIVKVEEKNIEAKIINLI
jgi:Icc-related predicted phosphoesterase